MSKNELKESIELSNLKAISVYELLQFESKPHEYILESWLIGSVLSCPWCWHKTLGLAIPEAPL